MNPDLFIIWKWKGWRGDAYSSENVNAFCRMLRANLGYRPNILCITDEPKGITECNVYPIWPQWSNLGSVGKPNCFRRLRLFDPAFCAELGLSLGQWYVSMDIDCVIRRPIDHLFKVEDDSKLRITEGLYAPYNGSMWMNRVGDNQHVWLDFHPVDSPAAIKAAKRKRRFVGSDQAWLSLQLPPEDVDLWKVGTRHDIMQYHTHVQDPDLPDSARLIFFAGGINPWNHGCMTKCPQLYSTYMSYVESA